MLQIARTDTNHLRSPCNFSRLQLYSFYSPRLQWPRKKRSRRKSAFLTLRLPCSAPVLLVSASHADFALTRTHPFLKVSLLRPLLLQLEHPTLLYLR